MLLTELLSLTSCGAGSGEGEELEVEAVCSLLSCTTAGEGEGVAGVSLLACITRLGGGEGDWVVTGADGELAAEDEAGDSVALGVDIAIGCSEED